MYPNKLLLVDAEIKYMGGNNYRSGFTGQSYDLDIAEISFIVLSALFALFYFTNPLFKYYAGCFYAFSSYFLKKYTAAAVLYLANLFLFFAGLHGLYVRIFEMRVSGSKLKMYNKLQKYNEIDKK